MDAPPLTGPAAPPSWGDVVLREFRDDDAEMVEDLATDPYVPQIRTLPFRADRDAALAYIARPRTRRLEGVGWSFCVADRSGLALGGAGLWVVPDDPGRMSAGYSVAPRARGHGFARQALRALTAFAWTLPLVQRVKLLVEPWNVASLRTAETAGYVRETVLHDQQLQDRRVDLVRLTAERSGSS